MLIVNSRKASLRIKLTLGQVLAEQIFCFFSFQGRFFPKHALRENGQKGLVCRREPTVMLQSYTAIGGYEPAGSFQIWYDATTQHFQEDHGLPPTKVLTEMLWVTPSPLAPPSPPPPISQKKNKQKNKNATKETIKLIR